MFCFAPAQNASRTKNPIADIKPASNAKSSTASIRRIVGSVFFRRFMVIRWLAPRNSTELVCLQVGRVFRLHPSTKDLQAGGFRRALLRTQIIMVMIALTQQPTRRTTDASSKTKVERRSKNPAAAELGPPRRAERRQSPKVSLE